MTVMHQKQECAASRSECVQVHMAAGDHASLIEDCMRLGDAARGGDPQLWSEVLDYFARQPQDCTEQVHCCQSSLL